MLGTPGHRSHVSSGIAIDLHSKSSKKDDLFLRNQIKVTYAANENRQKRTKQKENEAREREKSFLRKRMKIKQKHQTKHTRIKENLYIDCEPIDNRRATKRCPKTMNYTTLF